MSVLPIENLDQGVGGGKAQGLTILNCFKAQIPMSFVVREYHEKSILKLLRSLPQDTKFAIRSSAEDEDGEEFSFAGQYLSFLNVKGEKEVLEAVKKCFLSQKDETVSSYNTNLSKTELNGMNVIIQEMVEAVVSGVMFTADPVDNRHDKISLSITKGIGEELMAGHENGEQFIFFKNATKLPESEIISAECIKKLFKEGKDIDNKYGRPADLEWAIDKNRRIWWLQLRPITKISRVHLNELDNEPLYKDPIYTRGNIGEMMPGPVTPLTLSTFAKAIDVGLQVFYKKTGALKKISNEMLFIHSFYNHLFFDVNRLYESAKYVGLTKKENIDFSVVGQIVPGVKIKKEVNALRSLYNFTKMTRYINSSPKALKKLRDLYKNFKINIGENYEETYKNISGNLPLLNRAYELHYITSSQSGALYSTILNIYSGGKIPSKEDQKNANTLFSDIPDIESAEVVKALDEICQLVLEDKTAKVNFLDEKSELAINYLTKTGPDNVKKAWSDFLKRHGHRCIREAELFEKEWAEDPLSIVESIKAKVALLLSNGNNSTNGKKTIGSKPKVNGLGFTKKKIIEFILPKARKAVARREQTKAWSIGIQHKFKLAYRDLAGQLVKKNLLNDKEDIFFLTNDEIGFLIKGDKIDYWKNICKERRDQYPQMQQLSFKDLYFGLPIPDDEAVTHSDSELWGIPVSRGEVTAKLRIVNSIEDAAMLKEGEIMVAKFTDVGWTPYYSIIGGLITEIGSPLSHGAVVAREYGLPSIVSMKGATKVLKTGQTIKLDAVNGTVEVLN